MDDVSSSRPISLMEKILLKRMTHIIITKNLIPTHQFGFRRVHSTIDQIHQITKMIENAFETKKVCSAVFASSVQQTLA